ncbi:hypothetical protein A6V25_18055 [Nostoc sp. ATCC 53789]|nr:hypothetical protein A6V25_18055 [Nostoc sp. ATCC 53789]
MSTDCSEGTGGRGAGEQGSRGAGGQGSRGKRKMTPAMEPEDGFESATSTSWVKFPLAPFPTGKCHEKLIFMPGATLC